MGPLTARSPPDYQRYMSVDEQSIPGSSDEDQLSLWRPLFTTSFGVADFVGAIEEFAGANLKRTVIVGVSHWQDREGSLTEMLPGREFFFPPPQLDREAACGLGCACQSVLSGESRPDVGHILQFC